jgi:hypothetical protein
MYRDEREAFEARFEERRRLLRRDEARLSELATEVERRRSAPARARRARVLTALVPVVGAAVVVAGVTGIHALVFVPRQAEAMAMNARADAISKRGAPAREKLIAIEEERARLRKRLQQPPTYSAERTRLYGELRYLNAAVEEEAWLIVGAVSCSQRDTAATRQAREALPEARRSELDRLCEPWGDAP